MTAITSADIAIREAMKAETPELRHAALMKAWEHVLIDFAEQDAFVSVLAAHLTLVPVPQTVTA